jgi:hypothetical protein
MRKELCCLGGLLAVLASLEYVLISSKSVFLEQSRFAGATGAIVVRCLHCGCRWCRRTASSGADRPVDSAWSYSQLMRPPMSNDTRSSLVRRSFLRFGLVASLVGVLGCEGGAVQDQSEVPATKGGNRSRREALKEKATAAPKGKVK